MQVSVAPQSFRDLHFTTYVELTISIPSKMVHFVQFFLTWDRKFYLSTFCTGLSYVER